MYAPPSSGQHFMSGSLSRSTSSPRQTISCDAARRRAHARRKLPDLEQPRQQRSLAMIPSGTFISSSSVMRTPIVVERLDAERHAHAAHRAEEVDRRRETPSASVHQDRLLEEQRLAAARLLHHAIGDLAQLEIERDRLPNANELTGLLELRDEFGESVDAHDGGQTRSAPCVPRVDRGDAEGERTPTRRRRNPRARIRSASSLFGRKIRDRSRQVRVRASDVR